MQLSYRMGWVGMAAMANNRSIGLAGQLPWHIPEELAWFKQMTTGHTIVMGRKTYEGIGKPLPNRTTIVISRTGTVNGVTTCPSLDDLQQLDVKLPLFICGGAALYKAALPLCECIYLTHIKADYPGDCFLPAFEHFFHQQEVIREHPLFTIKKYTR